MRLPVSNSTSAYDFALFETVEKEQEKEQPKIQMAVPVSAAKTGTAFRIIAVAAMMLTVCLLFLYSKVELSELTTKISDENTALRNAVSINSALTAELSGEVNLNNVDDYALKNLGLQKIQKSQEEYVNINTGTLTEVAENNDGDFFVGVKNWFEGILEYLGF